MGTITTGTGLISGLPIRDIIDQLMAIEARPKQMVQSRVAILQSQQVAFQDINAKLLALKLSASGFISNKTFETTTAASSNESVLTASTTSSATAGTYSFVVDRLVSTQQLITGGFADKDTTALGGGTLTFEFGAGKLERDTQLTELNGGAGATRGKVRITDRSGASAVVDLSKALTVKDVLTAINDAENVSVTAAISGDRLVLQDTSGATTTNLSVVDSGTAGVAASLGLNVAAVGDTLTGGQINRITTDTRLSQLNDARGVDTNDALANHLRITRRDGTQHNINLAGLTTLGAVMTAIGDQTAGNVTAAIDGSGTGLTLTDNGADTGTTFAVTALNGSSAAADLGLLGSDDNADGVIASGRLIAAINSKLVGNLNGGAGVDLGTIRITNRNGASTDVDLSAAHSVSQIIEAINNAGAGVLASLNAAGNGVTVTDQTGGAGADLIIADLSGTAAADLKLDGSFSTGVAAGGNLQYQYIARGTLLSSLNGGQGISRGQFKITDSSGVTATVDLTQGNETTIGHVIDEINSRGLLINARVNDNGDGILIEDLGPGTVKLKVAESGSTTAANLGLLGEAAEFGQNLDGSFEKTITIAATDKLQDIANKINAAGLNVAATIINDGSGTTPFRLSLTARKAGTAGEFVFDDGGLGLGAATLSQARDALVFFGANDPAQGIAITSSTNSLAGVIPGATLDLKSASGSPVQVSISRSDAAITTAIQGFVKSFNDVLDTLNRYDTYDAETEQRGLLLGDSTVATIRSSIFRLANGRNSDLSGQFATLAQVGVTVGAGGKLQFNQARFDSALAADRASVQAIFTFKETATDSETGTIAVTAAGIVPRFDELLKTLTDGSNSTMQLRQDALDSQIKLSNDRIKNLDVLLNAKRGRLEAQFVAMERALSQIQGQSSALATLQQLAANAGSRSSR